MTNGDPWRPDWIDAEEQLDLKEVVDEGGSGVVLAVEGIHDDGSLDSGADLMGLPVEPSQSSLQPFHALLVTQEVHAILGLQQLTVNAASPSALITPSWHLIQRLSMTVMPSTGV